MADISEIFGSEKLSYDEFLIKASELGSEFGDVGEVRRAYESEILSVKRAAALERELDKSGAKNRGLITKIIDLDSIEVDGDEVHGIAEQISALRESDPYLFDNSPASPAQVRSIHTGIPHRHETVDSDSLSDADFYKQIKKM